MASAHGAVLEALIFNPLAGRIEMTVVIETFISCDGCGYNAADLSRCDTAAQQRKALGGFGGWRQVGSKDYCEQCVARGLHRAKPASKADPMRAAAAQIQALRRT